jgi:DNA-binding ferritin-like protein
MTKRLIDADAILNQAKPLTHQHAHEIQPFGHLVKLRIALAENVCRESVENLNQLLADTMTLRDLYKKHHWQLAGPTFYQLHLLFDKHYERQNESVDAIAERIQLLGGVSTAMAHDVAETTLIPRPPKGRKCSSMAKGEHIGPEAGIGRDHSQQVASPRRAGDQSKHARPVEARHAIRADVCSAGFADRLPVEQHGDRRIPRCPRLHDQVHLTGGEGNDDLAGALPKFDVLAPAVPITFQGSRARLPALGADVRLVGDPGV